jgi:hypothetical protein
VVVEGKLELGRVLKGRDWLFLGGGMVLFSLVRARGDVVNN